MKKQIGILFIAVVLLAALPASAGLPGLARPTRPVTDLRCARDGNDVVLTWTTAPTGTYRAIVTRGILQPRFRAEKIVAILGPGVTAWRDYGAITRTRLGVLVSEFYRIYALPGTAPVAALAPKTQIDEYQERPRDRQQVLRYDVTNGGQFALAPTTTVLGRDDDWRMPASGTPTAGAFLFDMENNSTPGGAAGRRVLLNGRPLEAYPSTVDHQGYDANAQLFLVTGDQTTPSSATRGLSAPAITRTDNAIAGALTPPTQDTAGSIEALEVMRTYEGVGAAEPAVLVATLAPEASAFTDDITGVTSGWWVFYQWRIKYINGDRSDLSASSAPIRR